MAHEFESGFSVRQPMWHGLGTVLDEHPDSWDDARLAAGLMWEPTEVPVYTVRHLPAGTEWPAGARALGGGFTPDPGERTTVAIEAVVPTEFKGVARDDTGDVLGVVSDSWAAITHAQMGEMLEALVGEDRAVKFETAGVLRCGRSVWALARLDEPYRIPGDPSDTYPYLALLNSHDGTGSAKVLPTQVRVVCWNTFNAASAMGDRTGRQVIIRHTGDVASRVAEAKLTLAKLREDVADYVELASHLAGITIGDDVVADFVELFIPTPENATERVRTDREQRRAKFASIYYGSDTTEGARGTAYGLLMTATEYLDHVRAYRSPDTYLSRTMLNPEPIKRNVLKVVSELAGAAR